MKGREVDGVRDDFGQKGGETTSLSLNWELIYLLYGVLFRRVGGNSFQLVHVTCY